VKIRVVGSAVSFLHVSMDKAPGNLAPLFTAGWAEAFIEQSNPLAGGVNVLNITIATNSPMYSSENSRIIILGVRNAVTASRSVPIYSNTPGVTSSFSDGNKTGHVLHDPAGVLSMTVVGVMEAQRRYNFWFVVRNPDFDQEFGNVEIYGVGGHE